MSHPGDRLGAYEKLREQMTNHMEPASSSVTRMSTVSVLMPVRNAATTVDAALASILQQTYADIEVLAVDDGSVDESRHRLHHAARNDDRVRVIPTTPRGIISALQTAADAATGKFLARMDADDISDQRRLERQVAWLDAHQEHAACGTRVRYFPRHALRAGARRYEQWINGVVTPESIARDMFVECPIPHPSLMVRRCAFDGVGGYRDVPWPEDYDLVLRLWRDGRHLAKVPEVLLHWRDGPARASRTDPRYSAEAFRRCKAHYLHHRTGGRPIVVWGAGPIGKAIATCLLDAGHELVGFVDLDPRKIGGRIRQVPVVSPHTFARSWNGVFVVAAVGQVGARDQIRGALCALDYEEPQDFCALA